MLVSVRAAIFLILLALLLSGAHAEQRLALLIGNEAYAPMIGVFANPHNDVALLERALKGLGFEVTTVRDAGLGTLYQAVNAYARRVQAAGPNTVGFFYYSGHGAQDAGTNYLIPVDVRTAESGELWDQSLRLSEITRKLKADAGNAMHFVVFDACRNALKLKQSGSRALVQSKGFVAVSQEPGIVLSWHRFYVVSRAPDDTCIVVCTSVRPKANVGHNFSSGPDCLPGRELANAWRCA
jgi:Caspase domain